MFFQEIYFLFSGDCFPRRVRVILSFLFFPWRFFFLFLFLRNFFFSSWRPIFWKKYSEQKKKFHGKKKISWSKEKIWIVKSPEKQREYPGKKKDSGIKKKKREFPGKQKSPEKSFSWGKHSRENIISWKKKKICTKKSAWKKKKQESPGERNSPEKYLKKISCEIKVCHTS